MTVEVAATDIREAPATAHIHYTVTGVNEASTLAAGMLAASKDGLDVSIDLRTPGDDVDSDDDAGTRT